MDSIILAPKAITVETAESVRVQCDVIHSGKLAYSVDEVVYFGTNSLETDSVTMLCHRAVLIHHAQNHED